MLQIVNAKKISCMFKRARKSQIAKGVKYD